MTHEQRVLDLMLRTLREAMMKPPPPGVCPECLQPRPGDQRVETGMRCGVCVYGGAQGALSE